MTPSVKTYRGSVLTGLAAWLVSIAVLHWLPSVPLDTRFTARMAALAAADCAFFAGLVYLLIRRRPAAQRFASTAAIVMPVAFGDAIAMAFFKDFFPAMDTGASGMFAALLLLTSGVVLATGFVAGLGAGAGAPAVPR